MKKKLYLVKREVMATSIKQALKEKGKVYSVELADEKFQPEEITKNLGYNPTK